MPECPECGSPPAPGQTTCRDCGVSLPGWKFAASAYATTLQPDYDADWADDASLRAAPPSFEAQHGSSRLLTTAPPAVTLPAGRSTAREVVTDAEVEAEPARERVPLWTPADAVPRPSGVDAQMPWRTLIALLVLASLSVSAYLAYPRAHDWWVARSVPGDLRAYIGGKGVPYSPAGEGYSVRLPKVPVHSGIPRASLRAPWVAIDRSVVTGPDYEIVVRVAQLPRGGELPFGAAGALGDPSVAGDVAAINLRAVTFAGQLAFDYDGSGEHVLRGRTFLRGARLYVVTVESAGADEVLDELMRSFTLVAA